jgi:uncharacterized membrane protein
MPADVAAAPPPAPERTRSTPPPELILLGLAVLSLALLPIELHRAFGLPAHPLIIHVPVILVPLVGLAALALMARPDWAPRWGVPAGVFAVAANAATILAVGAGEALRADRGGGRPDEVAKLDEHAQAGETLRILMFLFTIALLATLWAHRTGRLRGPLLTPARIVVAGLAIASIFFVIRTGHLGAQLTWGDSGGRPAGGVPPGFAPPGG